MVIASLGAVSAPAAEEVSREYELKAAFMLKFISFVTWPEEVLPRDATSVKLCVLGTNPFGDVLDGLAKKASNSRPIEVQYVERPEDLPECHMLFVSRSLEASIDSILGTVGDKPVLTVSDLPGFSHRGGMVTFVVKENRVRFQINRSQAEAGGLQLSARLLDLAEVVDVDADKERGGS